MVDGFQWKSQNMKIFNSKFFSNLGMVMCEATTRWWSNSGRSLFFLIIMAILLPYVCSDESHVMQGYGEGNFDFQYAEINISFMDPGRKKEVFSSFQGRFGRKSKIASASGTVMHAVSSDVPKGHKKPRENHYGCTDYTNKKFPSEKWIALVSRGECVFTDKLRKATKEYNASALVIYDNSSSTAPPIMDHKDLDSIAVLIHRKDGLMIAELLKKGQPVHMHIVPGEMGNLGSSMQNSISKTSVLFVSISFIVLMIISLAWLVFYYIQRFRYSHAKERLARRLACAAKKAIAKIPQKTVKVGDKELDGEFDQCAVCIEPYKAHEVIRIMPCRHVFHKSCVDPWLLDQRSCPMCKLDILRAYGMQIGGSQESVHHDPESGPVTTVVQEPEVSSSVEDTQTEEVKVLLVPHPYLHYHVGHPKASAEDDEAEASTSLLGSVQTSGSTTSLHSKSSINSRAQRSDVAEGGSTETKALIGKGKGRGKRTLKSEEEDEDFENDFDDRVDKNYVHVAEDQREVVAQVEDIKKQDETESNTGHDLASSEKEILRPSSVSEEETEKNQVEVHYGAVGSGDTDGFSVETGGKEEFHKVDESEYCV